MQNETGDYKEWKGISEMGSSFIAINENILYRLFLK
jgi:hypothetical protein